jgi:dipeptide/tripeptide permease
MSKRTPFPKVFWVANTIEVLERFAYYGIYMPLGLYLASLGLSKGDLGFIQSILLGFSYLLPLFSGTFADKYGFKKLLMLSYAIYIPAMLLFTITDTLGGIAMAMLTLGFAAGLFKPLISATVRAVTDETNKTLGFGIFYQMVNLGASIGPIVMGKLRGWSWDYVFYAAAAAMTVAALVTLIFYKEPARDIEGVTLKKKFLDIYDTLSDVKFLVFIILLGVFFWLPFWAFFNVLTVYINDYLDTVQLYESVKSVLGEWFTNSFIANKNETDGVWRLNAEAISHTGYIIIIFQLLISRIFEGRKAIPSFLFGLVIAALGFVILGWSAVGTNELVFLGVFVFAVGEMISSPRIQEYIMWIAPKEKAGLYMGTNFLATFIGALLSGLYTGALGKFEQAGNPQNIMYTLAIHTVIGILAIWIFTKTMGEFKERTE